MEAEVNTLLPLVQIAWCYLKNEEEKTQHKTKQNNNTHTHTNKATAKQNKNKKRNQQTKIHIPPLSAPSLPPPPPQKIETDIRNRYIQWLQSQQKEFLQMNSEKKSTDC